MYRIFKYYISMNTQPTPLDTRVLAYQQFVLVLLPTQVSLSLRWNRVSRVTIKYWLYIVEQYHHLSPRGERDKVHWLSCLLLFLSIIIPNSYWLSCSFVPCWCILQQVDSSLPFPLCSSGTGTFILWCTGTYSLVQCTVDSRQSVGTTRSMQYQIFANSALVCTQKGRRDGNSNCDRERKRREEDLPPRSLPSYSLVNFISFYWLIFNTIYFIFLVFLF